MWNKTWSTQEYPSSQLRKHQRSRLLKEKCERVANELWRATSCPETLSEGHRRLSAETRKAPIAVEDLESGQQTVHERPERFDARQKRSASSHWQGGSYQKKGHWEWRPYHRESEHPWRRQQWYENASAADPAGAEAEQATAAAAAAGAEAEQAAAEAAAAEQAAAEAAALVAEAEKAAAEAAAAVAEAEQAASAQISAMKAAMEKPAEETSTAEALNAVSAVLEAGLQEAREAWFGPPPASSSGIAPEPIFSPPILGRMQLQEDQLQALQVAYPNLSAEEIQHYYAASMKKKNKGQKRLFSLLDRISKMKQDGEHTEKDPEYQGIPLFKYHRK